VNQDYGIPKEQDINSLQPNDIDHGPEVHYDHLDDIDPLQNPQEHLEPDQPQPPEPIEPEVSDQGASTTPRRSMRTRTQPQRLIPSHHGKSYDTTAGVTTHLIYPEAHIDPNYTLVAHIVMVQCSMKAGMKQLKQRGEDAVSKEFSQLHFFRDTFEPINPKDLTNEEHKEVLESHLFLKEKRDATVKGRMVAGGNKQRDTIEKLDASSPTAALESVLLTAIIDAHEGRDVAVIDILNAFVQTRLEDDADKAIMRLRGKLAELMVKVAPEIYTKYVIINSKGETVLNVRLLNALYGIMKAALLYYQRFVTDLKSIGFEINPYDPCIANKILKGKQLTVIWHVDDLKVSHVSSNVVTKMADWLKSTYERLFDDGSGEMKICRGKIHEWLGMTLDFTVDGEVKVTMIPYVKEIVQQFQEHDNSTKTAATPAAEHLFKSMRTLLPSLKDKPQLPTTSLLSLYF
jgi:hypothetical protein